jgi:hypothetical protein
MLIGLLSWFLLSTVEVTLLDVSWCRHQRKEASSKEIPGPRSCEFLTSLMLICDFFLCQIFSS